jgi:hypothetical protein
MIDNVIIQLEDEISKLVYSDNGRTVHFEYCGSGNQVNAYTYNKTNRETFLLKKAIGSSYQECLEKILIYIKENEKSYDSYTVIWSRKGRNERNMSYFYCTDVIDVINKFFDGKDKKLYIVYEIKMNPKS